MMIIAIDYDTTCIDFTMSSLPLREDALSAIKTLIAHGNHIVCYSCLAGIPSTQDNAAILYRLGVQRFYITRDPSQINPISPFMT